MGCFFIFCLQAELRRVFNDIRNYRKPKIPTGYKDSYDLPYRSLFMI
jgi:hypothetical protein